MSFPLLAGCPGRSQSRWTLLGHPWESVAVRKRGLAKKAFKATAAVATFGGSVAAEKVATTLRNKDDPGIDVAVVERIEAANRL